MYIRLLLLVVHNTDSGHVFRSALPMLECGKWLQWNGLDSWGAYNVQAAIQHEKQGERFRKGQELTAISTLISYFA